jgi:hypothetical protein
MINGFMMQAISKEDMRKICFGESLFATNGKLGR